MRKSRNGEREGERKKSPLIMHIVGIQTGKWVPIKKENKITKKMDDTYILVQDDEEVNATINDTNRGLTHMLFLKNIQNLSNIVSH